MSVSLGQIQTLEKLTSSLYVSLTLNRLLVTLVCMPEDTHTHTQSGLSGEYANMSQ